MNKKLFVEYLTTFNNFDNAIGRLGKAFIGDFYSDLIYETDWYEYVGKMYNIFLQSHFTEYGIDLINAFLFEDCREFWVDKDRTLFEDKKKEHYTFDTLEELYDVMRIFKEEYFLQ